MIYLMKLKKDITDRASRYITKKKFTDGQMSGNKHKKSTNIT